MTDTSITVSCAILVVNAAGTTLDDYEVIPGTISEINGKLEFRSRIGTRSYTFPPTWKARLSETPWDQLDSFANCRFFIPVSESLEKWLSVSADELHSYQEQLDSEYKLQAEEY